MCGSKFNINWEKNCPYTENQRNAQKLEFLGEFKTKIENILGD